MKTSFHKTPNTRIIDLMINSKLILTYYYLGYRSALTPIKFIKHTDEKNTYYNALVSKWAFSIQIKKG